MTSTSETALSPRQVEILAAVCRAYLLTGGETSSGALVCEYGLRWSSATVRQELAALESYGLLSRPHRSAGCRPTGHGLQRYVQTLVVPDPKPELVQAVERSLGETPQTPQQTLRAAVRVLSQAVGGVAVSFYGTARPGTIAQLDVVNLVGQRALVVLTLQSGLTNVYPIELGSDTEPPVDPLRLQARLRWLCVNRTLHEAREELGRLMGEQQARLDRVLVQAIRVAQTVCSSDPLDPLWLHVAGQPTLARDLAGWEQLEELLGLLEDYQRLAEVLFQLLPHSGQANPRADIHVGCDGLFTPGSEEHPSGLTLIGCRLPQTEADDEHRGAVAILGSDRLDYASVIPLVEYAARALAARVCA